jgi:hypothetical protein
LLYIDSHGLAVPDLNRKGEIMKTYYFSVTRTGGHTHKAIVKAASLQAAIAYLIDGTYISHKVL